ncbi:WD40 repeat domain-containing protein [Nostoc sp.]|uniref:WD40 repeat domain-containing protein n=1 Tax=Nostoc sp. TaxID=1180 RepID=UPI002FFC2CC0
MAIDLSSTMLASGSDDKEIKIWDLKTKREMCTLSGHESYIMSAAFSPDGKFLASSSHDRSINLLMAAVH